MIILRKLENEDEAIALLREGFKSLKMKDMWEIEVVMHKKDRSPCELADLIGSADVLVTPHGFQSMLVLFMAAYDRSAATSLGRG